METYHILIKNNSIAKPIINSYLQFEPINFTFTNY